MAGGETVHIHTVCTGNICRSPYAHLLLARRLEEAAPGEFTVDSSGTAAMLGEAVDPFSASHLDGHGVAHASFAASQASARALEAADLVLVMERVHLGWVVEEAPRAARRTFTLKELARLLATLDDLEPWPRRLADLGPGDTRERWTRIVATASRERRRLRLRRASSDDLADPYRRGAEAFATMAAQVESAVDTIVGVERVLRQGISS